MDMINVNGVLRPRMNSLGEPIAATEQEIVDFWRWFGDSRVVDDQGRPLVAYHGTDVYDEIEKFRRGSKGVLGPGIYFTDRRSNAEPYANRRGPDGRIYEACVRIRNPLIVTGTSNGYDGLLKAIYGRESVVRNRENKQSNPSNMVTAADALKLRRQGYDGIIWQHPAGNEFVVYESNQVRRVAVRRARESSLKAVEEAAIKQELERGPSSPSRPRM